jgi:hypothetical protein
MGAERACLRKSGGSVQKKGIKRAAVLRGRQYIFLGRGLVLVLIKEFAPRKAIKGTGVDGCCCFFCTTQHTMRQSPARARGAAPRGGQVREPAHPRHDLPVGVRALGAGRDGVHAGRVPRPYGPQKRAVDGVARRPAGLEERDERPWVFMWCFDVLWGQVV